MKIEIKLKGGRTHPDVIRINDTVRRPKHHNDELVYDVLNFFEKQNFKYAPKFLGIDSKHRNIFSYIDGYCFDEVGFTDQKHLIEILNITKEFHTLSKKYTQSNKVICHNDISPLNVVFDNNLSKINGIIDWDSVSIDHNWLDVCYILILWINIGDPSKPVDKIFQELKIGLKTYNDSEIAKNLSDKFIYRIDKINASLNKNNKWYQKTKDWVDYLYTWIDNHKTRIDNLWSELV
ncbi:phosphotransferase [Mycoplasma sp. E35C]|uniref:phosphotransferase n=1 Tax=Mycoplasma sp. E35C TaxID=2801918 RepID=UPI001CA4068A|nr:phosphotransferase [Mycoplasma sp. E35C]QZX49476.1 phosphotransferase [Mycoplasma sp. E35C]